MSDDQRVEAAKVAILDRIGNSVDFLLKRPLSARLAKASIDAADAADRDARIHRMRVDDETVERVAAELHKATGSGFSWEWVSEYRDVEHYRRTALAVLAALTEGES